MSDKSGWVEEIKVESIRRTSAAEEVFKALHDWIVTGRLHAGDRLPSQDKLAEQFAVSRNTVREAVNKLLVMGLITVKQGLGMVVQPSSPTSYVTSLYDHLLLNPATVREFLEARVFVEKATVRLAVTRAGVDDIETMQHIIAQQFEAVARGETEAFSKLDVDFHMALARASGNKVLLKFLETIWGLLQKFIAEVSRLPDAMEHAVRFHSEILELIRSQDRKKAEDKILQHLYDVAQTIEKHMGMDLGADFLFQQDCNASESMKNGFAK